MTTKTDCTALQRADELLRLEMAAAALAARPGFDFRAGWAAILAALISLIPSISAAQILF